MYRAEGLERKGRQAAEPTQTRETSQNGVRSLKTRLGGHTLLNRMLQGLSVSTPVGLVSTRTHFGDSSWGTVWRLRACHYPPAVEMTPYPVL